MTNEELDEARAKEAQLLWESGQEAGSSSWVVAARLAREAAEARIAELEARIAELEARENWTPPEPVDPDLLAFREWALVRGDDRKFRDRAAVMAGKWDYVSEADAYLAGARMAREREQERAKGLVERVEIYAGPYDAVALAKYRGEA